MKEPTNWYAVGLSTLRAWPIAAGLCVAEALRRGMGLPWYTVPATLAATALLAGVVLAYALLEDWLRYKADEWQCRERP